MSTPDTFSGAGTRFVYGTLTEDFIKALPDKPMQPADWFGDSTAAKRIRALSGAYGPISGAALTEAMKEKYRHE